MDGSATLPRELWASLAGPVRDGAWETGLDSARELDRFLKDVERRAFRMAEIALRNADDALDVVQEAMIQLAQSYGSRPAEEWKPLFYRILQNRIHDWQRRRRTRSKIIAWWTGGVADDEDDAPDPIENAAATDAGPGRLLEGEEAMAALERALADLPARQQQAFLLRTLEGLDVAATAAAMGCSEGSVKTHYFRALQALRAQLGEHWS
ncbi:MAG: RNA polymerase sigma factor [Proteobacteria bacterium]|nr:RNA polymerase sigma factor [Pseudomonadota bacterium]